MSNVKTCITLNKEVRENAQEIFDELGLTFSGAIEVFLRAVIKEQGLPFHVTTKKMQEDIVYATVSLEEGDPNEGVDEDG